MTNSNDDDVLWALVTRDIKPIKGRRIIKKADEKTSVSPAQKKKVNKSLQTGQTHHSQISAGTASESGGDSLDRRTDERLRRGQMKIDGTLDLHGMNQKQAYDAVRSYILSRYRQDARCLLVITGKGGLGEHAGVLRQKLPEWLNEPPLDNMVLRAYPARARHGGIGAFYVLLRRRRTE